MKSTLYENSRGERQLLVNNFFHLRSLRCSNIRYKIRTYFNEILDPHFKRYQIEIRFI